MEQSYKKVMELCPDLDAEMYFQLGWLYFDYKNGETRKPAFNKFCRSTESMKIMEPKQKNACQNEAVCTSGSVWSSTCERSFNQRSGIPSIHFSDNELAFFTRRYELKERNMLTPQSVEKFNGDCSSESSWCLIWEHRWMKPFNKSSSNNEGGASINW